MSELERERHKNAGLERARDSWYQEYQKVHVKWSEAVVRIAELEAEVTVRDEERVQAEGAGKRLAAQLSRSEDALRKAEAALAETERMLEVAVMEKPPERGVYLRKNWPGYLADLRARAAS